MSDLHINTGGGSNFRRMVGCPVCGITDAPVVRHVPGSPYYADDCTCTVCGDSWCEGWIGERPFRRGWRQEYIARAVANWEAACECPVTRDDDLYVIPCEHSRAAVA